MSIAMGTESQELPFESLCRTCMHEVSRVTTRATNTDQPTQPQWQYIFNTVDECDSMRVVDLLTRLMPQLQLNFNEELPQRICKICLEYLLNAYRFQQMCLQSEQQLRDLVAKKQSDGKLITTETDKETKSSILSEPIIERTKIDASNTPNEDPLQNSEEMVAQTESVRASHVNIEMDTPADVLIIETKSTTSDEGSRNGDTYDSDWATNETVMPSKPKYSNGENAAKTMPSSEKLDKASSSTYVCNICKKSFSIRGYLLKHLKRHKKSEQRGSVDIRLCEKTEETPLSYDCNICKKSFTLRGYLLKHLSRHKKAEEQNTPMDKPYKCEFCDKSYKQYSTLTDHIRTHTGEQPYLCSECGKAFTSFNNLKQHLLRHSGDKAYECPVCPKKFSTISDLGSHKLIHRQFKPHVCDICGYAFGTAYQMKKHKMHHNGEKPHKCDYCDKRFVCRDHKSRHMRTHTGEKPYKCKYCERAFAQSNDHIKHLRTHLGENVYKCELCPKSFRLATELRVHFAEHKHDDEETRSLNMQALADEEICEPEY